jgi:hypothetical protein
MDIFFHSAWVRWSPESLEMTSISRLLGESFSCLMVFPMMMLRARDLPRNDRLVSWATADKV